MDRSTLTRGCYAMCITPFDQHGRIDEDTLREHLRWLAAEGICPVPASPSSGDGTLLSDEEVFRIWEIVVDEAGGRFPVIAANREFPTAEQNIRFAQEAEERGLDGIQVYPATLGHLLKPTAPMLHEFYDAVLSQVELPVLISSNESTGFEVPLEVHRQLVDRHDNVFAIYKNGFDFLRSATFYGEVAPQVPVFTGFIRLPMAALLGATGELDYIQNIAPRTSRRMHDAIHSGDRTGAEDAYAALVRIQSRTSAFWVGERLMRVPVYKAILRLLGRPGEFGTRPPFQPLTREQDTRLAALIDELDLRQLEGLA